MLAPLWCRPDPVSAKDVAHGLIGNRVAEIGQGSDDAVVPPTGVLSGEAHNERFQFGRDAGPAWRSTEFGAVELAGNEPPVPGEDGIGFGDTGDLLKRSPAESQNSTDCAKNVSRNPVQCHPRGAEADTLM